MNKQNIVLIGMPGSGKSTCGVIAAKILLKNFFDTDLLLQGLEQSRLQELIDSRGEEYFFAAEESAILSLKLEATVIATGGSVIYSDKAMRHLKKLGKVIYLHLVKVKLMMLVSGVKNFLNLWVGLKVIVAKILFMKTYNIVEIELLLCLCFLYLTKNVLKI